MSKRWGYDQLSRWLNGERDMPVYFESAPVLHEPATNDHTRALSFMGEKHTSLETFARAVASDETSWAKGRELLMRGNIRAWLERNNESERAEELYSLIEDVDDLNEKVFKFVHFYGKPLPFVYMGKAITIKNLHLYLWKNLWQKEASKAETLIIEKLFDGKYAPLLDFYLQHNEPNDEHEALKVITSNVEVETPESIYIYLDIIVNRSNYFLPFLNSQSSLSDAAKAISIIKNPMTLERWNELYQGYVIPMKDLRSVDTYLDALERIEKLNEDKLLFIESNLPNDRQTELENCNVATYTEEAYREILGYDNDTVSLLNNLEKKFEKLSTDKYKNVNYDVAIKYIDAFIRKSVMITDEDKELLKFMSKYSASFENVTIAIDSINEVSPSEDKIVQSKADHKRINAEKSKNEYYEILDSWKRTIMKEEAATGCFILLIIPAFLFVFSIAYKSFIGLAFTVLFIIIFALYKDSIELINIKEKYNNKENISRN
jgi:hypothetical protein